MHRKSVKLVFTLLLFMNDKKIFKLFLEQNGFLPYSGWHLFFIEHGEKDNYKKNIKEIIKPIVGNKGGLYIYKKGDKIIYIGKAKRLYDRLKSHCRESFEKVSGDTKLNTWHRFFSDPKNKGQLTVYWKEVILEEERVIFENMLQYILNPEFNNWRKDFEGNN